METPNKTNEVKGKLQDTLDQTKDMAQNGVAGAKDKAQGLVGEIKSDIEQSGIKSDYENLKADFQALRSDVMGLVESLKGSAAVKAKEVSADLLQSGEHVAQRALDAVGTVKEKGSELASSLETQVKERPLMSILVAFGAGIVLSRMLRH